MVQKINDLNLALKPHIWLGVSVESQRFAESRLPPLLSLPVETHFVSAEPLLGPVDLAKWLPDLQWVIAGGESGSNYRPMDLDWVRVLRDQCVESAVAFFYKQNANFRPDQDRVLDGRTWDQYPQQLEEPVVVDHQPSLL